MKATEMRAKRKEKKISQEALARLIDVSQVQVSHYENGLRRPSVKTAKKIAAVLGFDWTEFYEEKE